MIMMQGALGHTGAQGGAKIEVLDTRPADWEVTKVARIWESL